MAVWSVLRLRALRAAGARIIPGHDPEAWATVPQAPSALALWGTPSPAAQDRAQGRTEAG